MGEGLVDDSSDSFLAELDPAHRFVTGTLIGGEVIDKDSARTRLVLAPIRPYESYSAIEVHPYETLTIGLPFLSAFVAPCVVSPDHP